MKRIAINFVASSAVAVVAGCSASSIPFYDAGTELRAVSQSHEGVRLRGEFDRAVYSLDDRNTVTLVLFAGPEESPSQAAVIRMFWRPRAGGTPIASSATNASVQYVVFADADDRREVGVYSGAGFLYPNSRPGQDRLSAGLWQATLRLADASAGFEDRLGKATLSGDVSARRDDAAVNRLVRQLERVVTERLGYPRLVEAASTPPTL